VGYLGGVQDGVQEVVGHEEDHAREDQYMAPASGGNREEWRAWGTEEDREAGGGMEGDL